MGTLEWRQRARGRTGRGALSESKTLPFAHLPRRQLFRAIDAVRTVSEPVRRKTHPVSVKAADKTPWVAAGMSRASWFRMKARAAARAK